MGSIRKLTNEEKEDIYQKLKTYIREDFTQKEVDKLITLLNKLKVLFKDGIRERDTSAGSETYKMRYRRIIEDESKYNEALALETQILDLLRKQELSILIHETVRNSAGEIVGVNQAFTLEKKLRLSDVRSGGENAQDYIAYLKEKTKELKIINKRQEAFVKHYDSYYRTALDIIGGEKKLKKLSKNDSLNEGHIIEAFYRHMNYWHGGVLYDKDENYTEELNPRYVAIELHLRDVKPWFTGGDLNSIQIKGDNDKLASLLSIEKVADKLLMMYEDPTGKIIDKQLKETFFSNMDQHPIDYDDEAILKDLVNDKALKTYYETYIKI